MRETRILLIYFAFFFLIPVDKNWIVGTYTWSALGRNELGRAIYPYVHPSISAQQPLGSLEKSLDGLLSLPALLRRYKENWIVDVQRSSRQHFFNHEKLLQFSAFEIKVCSRPSHSSWFNWLFYATEIIPQSTTTITATMRWQFKEDNALSKWYNFFLLRRNFLFCSNGAQIRFGRSAVSFVPLMLFYGLWQICCG